MTIDLRFLRSLKGLVLIAAILVLGWLAFFGISFVSSALGADNTKAAESTPSLDDAPSTDSKREAVSGERGAMGRYDFSLVPLTPMPPLPSSPLPDCTVCEPAGLPLKAESPVYVTCRFHDPAAPQHSGLDFPVDEYTEIVATHDGVVIFAGHDPIYGNMVILENYQWKTQYAHNVYLLVREGDLVQAGDLLALAGHTGVSDGNHVHYEVRDALNTRRDPEKFMDIEQLRFAACNKTADDEE